MRSRSLFYAILFTATLLVLPLAAHAAGASIPFFGPIIPDEINVCAAGWGSVINVINNIIKFLITIVIVFIAPIMIAWAGFLYVVNPMNPGGMAKAKSILQNTVAGIVVALAAWLIVGAVMAALTPNGRPFGENWASIITSDGSNNCLIEKNLLQKLNQTDLEITGIGSGGNTVSVSGKSGALCSDKNTACSPAALQAAGFTPTQANVMSCIAGTENSGKATGCNGNACGVFQIMITVNPLVGSECAKYNNGDSTLNCPVLCKGNNGVAVKTSECQPCVQAANDPKCNAQAAQYLYSKSGYGPWTTSSDNKNSAACVQQYDNG